MTDSANVSSELQDGVLTITFLDAHLTVVPQHNEPWKTIEALLQDQAPSSLVLNFSKVNYLSSAALGKIVGLRRKFGGEVALSNLSETLSSVFRVTKLDRVFKVSRSQS